MKAAGDFPRTLVVAALATATAGSAQADGARFEEVGALSVPELRLFVCGQRLQFLDDGRVVLSGPFSEVNGAPRSLLVRLRADGAVDETFVPDAAFPTDRLWSGPWIAAPDGRVYFGVAAQNDYYPDRLRRLNPDGTLDNGYELAATIDVGIEDTRPIIWRLTRGSGGWMLVSGMFTRLGGVVARDVALLRVDGSVDETFAFGANGSLIDALPMADGRWVVVTQALDDSSATPMWRTVVSRITSSGALDPGFTPYGFDVGGLLYGAHAFALDARERVVFAEPAPGDPSDEYRLRLGRLLGDGTRDAGFAPLLPLIRDGNDLRDFAAQFAAAGTAEPAAGTLIWIPPHVQQIVADDVGGVECVARWVDRAYRGAVHVSDSGTVTASALPGEAGDRIAWLTRDEAGRWWGELNRTTAEPRGTHAVRFLDTGGVDPVFAVEARAVGFLNRAAALDDGAVAIEGVFDEVAGVPAPGVAVLEGDGTLREMEALPWPRAEIVRALADGSLVFRPPPEPAIITIQPAATAGATGVYLDPGDPLVARVFADGTVQPLLPAVNPWLRPRDAWLDASGRLVVHVPGYAGSDGRVASDLVRFFTDGEVDDTLRARQTDETPLSLDMVAMGSEGASWWGLVQRSDTVQLFRFDASGRETDSMLLSPQRLDERWAWPTSLTGVAGGVVVGGVFDRLDGVLAPGVARVGDDGRVDADWGGWLAMGSHVTAVRALASGLIEVSGQLHFPGGRATVVYLRADGLPDFNAEAAFQVSDVVAPQVASPSGGWIARVAERSEPDEHFVRRWNAVPVPEVPLTAPTAPVEEGATVELRVSWSGVPATIEWLRNGERIDGGGDGVLTILVHRGDDGAVFVARLRFEDGSILYTRTWRLAVKAPSICLVNGSIRASGSRGEDALVVGCVVEGGTQGALLARGLGPALGNFGIAGFAWSVGARLLDDDGSEVAAPANYKYWHDFFGVSHADVVAAAREVGAYFAEMAPASGNDQMLYLSTASGAYHLHVEAIPQTPRGVMLGEVFSLNRGAGARGALWLRNLSGRARIAAGGDVLIGGFVIEGTGGVRVLVRGVGPGLAPFGIGDPATNPAVVLHGPGGEPAVNDDWSDDPANRAAVAEASAQVGAFSLADGSTDAALVVELGPGVYTVVTTNRGDDDGGIALLEVYVVAAVE